MLTLIDLFDGGLYPKITYQYNALNFITNMVEVPWFSALAVTFGNVVVYGYNGNGPNAMARRYDRTNRVQIGLHEKAHTYQWQLMGLGFLALYFGTGEWTKPSFLENAANNYAETGGWWL